MQLKRNYFRRVKVLEPFINENCPSSRRAYVSIPLAVKTSRPHWYEFLIANLQLNLLLKTQFVFF